MLRHTVAFLASTMVAMAAWAQEPALPRVVILNISASGVSSELTATLSEVLVSAVREEMRGKATVIGQREITAMISLERQRDLLGCSDTACLAEIGGALGADQLVTASLGK